MEESILRSTKKNLMVSVDDDAFDDVIITHINSVFADLNQLGIGPETGFAIDDDTTEWGAYLVGDLNLNSVKTYFYLRVRLLFDPPATSFHLTALQAQIDRMEFRLNVKREGESWVDPNLPVTP